MDEETRLTWYLKDEIMRLGRVYYAKLAGGAFDVCRAALFSLSHWERVRVRA
jgi:hypothetical protein